MHTHWLTDPTCYGSVLYKSEHNRSRSLPSVSLSILYLFLICTDANPMALLTYTEAITVEMPLRLPGCLSSVRCVRLYPE